jgi:ABC-type dipeptide/oligopeptide/nickel transport system permease subunit
MFILTAKTWSESIQVNYTLQNSIAAFVSIAIIYFVYKSLRDERGRGIWSYMLRKKLATISFVILCVFVLIGILDCYKWRDPLLDGNGNVTTDLRGTVIYQNSALSILDRLCSGIRTKTEKTYSAPMSDRQFTKDLVQSKDGESVWYQEKLNYPGAHLLGTDVVGRDVLYICLKGIRTALIIGGFTTMISIPIALVLGVIAGYFGKWLDVSVQFVYSTIGSIPFILIAAAYILIQGASIFNLCVIMGVTGWTSLCRLLRGETLKTRELDYVQGAIALGAGHTRILFRHIVPNIFHLVLITSVLGFSHLVLAEAVLSYLKIGVGQSTFSWGNMINQANLELAREPIVWWNLLGAFLFMMALVLPANLFGDALRDALDPKLRGLK